MRPNYLCDITNLNCYLKFKREMMHFSFRIIGKEISTTYRCILGCCWYDNAVHCGSRGSIFFYVPLSLNIYFGARSSLKYILFIS